jgi:hypothetical protein
MASGVRRLLVVVSCGLVLSACGQPAKPSFVAGSPADSAPGAAGAHSGPPPAASPKARAGGNREGSTDVETHILGAQFPAMAPEVEAYDDAAPAPARDLNRGALSPAEQPDTSRTPAVQEYIPSTGTRTFTSAAGGSPVVGTGSTHVTYKVQVENGVLAGWTPSLFAAKVDAILADNRSWRAAGTWSFQRVGPSTTPSVYIRLATRDTVDYYCGLAGVHTQGKYSCRYGSYVMINLDRWIRAVPGFGVDIAGYRYMVVNHEVGHFLGYHHMACPAAGQLAPVMQTQTIALNGCLPNSWPYPDGHHFVSGPPAPA